MEKPVKGDVVVVPFPYSDLSSAKRRPAVVAASLEGEDVILCQVTSRARKDAYSVSLSSSDFSSGGLPVESIIRPNRLFTANSQIIIRKAGSLEEGKINAVENILVKLFTA